MDRVFRINDLNLAALEWPGEGLPLIALHGWLDNAASFQLLAPHLKNVYLLAPDLPGHGHSDHLPPAASYHLADTCRWVVALADAMGWQRFALMGHSMGAAAASIAAAALPQRIAGLVLLEGLGPLAFTPEQEVKRLRQLFSAIEGPKSRLFADRASAARLRQRLGRFPISHEAATLITCRGMSEVDGGYRWRHDERLKGPSTHYYSAEQSEGVLRAIEVPTLLISASDGALSGWAGFAQRKGCIRRLQHAMLEGGHHLHMEEPEAVAAVVNRFMTTLQEEDGCSLSN